MKKSIILIVLFGCAVEDVTQVSAEESSGGSGCGEGSCELPVHHVEEILAPEEECDPTVAACPATACINAVACATVACTGTNCAGPSMPMSAEPPPPMCYWFPNSGTCPTMITMWRMAVQECAESRFDAHVAQCTGAEECKNTQWFVQTGHTCNNGYSACCGTSINCMDAEN